MSAESTMLPVRGKVALTPEIRRRPALSQLLIDEMGVAPSAASAIARSYSSTAAHPAAQTSAPLRDAIVYHIEEYKKQSFEKFCMNICVSPVVGARPLRRLLSGSGSMHIGHDAYQFEPRHSNQTASRLFVRFDDASVQVFFEKKWQTLHTFLDSLDTQWSWPMLPELAYSLQFDWWQTNGKSFDLKALPGELRNRLYELNIGPAARPFRTARSRNGLHPLGRANMAIARVSKAVSSEFNHVLYGTTTFELDNVALTRQFLRNNVLRTRVRKLTLQMSLSEYFLFFGLDNAPGKLPFARKHVVKGLRAMSLTSFRMKFKEPRPHEEEGWVRGACRGRAIDLLINAAWPSIRGHPLQLAGYIDPEQKARLEARALEATKNPAGGGANGEEDAGTRLEGLTWDGSVAMLK